MNIWKNFTTEDAMVIVEKLWKPSAPNNKFYRKTVSRFHICDVTGFIAEPIKEILKEGVDIKKKKRWGMKDFKIQTLEKFKS